MCCLLVTCQVLPAVVGFFTKIAGVFLLPRVSLLMSEQSSLAGEHFLTNFTLDSATSSCMFDFVSLEAAFLRKGLVTILTIVLLVRSLLLCGRS